MKQPAFQFYVGDWLSDVALRAVSSASRGLWIDMLCLMWQAPRRGYLQHANGHPFTQEQLARATGNSVDEVASMLQELEDCGVLSRSGDGAVFSRRMVRDADISRLRQQAGRQGGNPCLVKQTANQTATNRQPNGEQKPNQKGGSSSSSSPSGGDSPSSPSGAAVKTGAELHDEAAAAVLLPEHLDKPEVREALTAYFAERRLKRKYVTPGSVAAMVRALSPYSAEEAVAACNASVANGWTGVFPERIKGSVEVRADERKNYRP